MYDEMSISTLNDCLFDETTLCDELTVFVMEWMSLDFAAIFDF